MPAQRRDILKAIGVGSAGALLPVTLAGTAASAAPTGQPASVAGRRPVAGQADISLDGAWRFATDPGGTGTASGFATSAFNDAAWAVQQVPGNWDTQDSYAGYRGLAWYRDRVAGPAIVAGQVVRLRFEAAYYQAKVWFNGSYLGEHKGGYTAFEHDVTALLAPTGDNTIAVAVDNTYSIGAWWPWGGFSRSVSFTVNDAVRIERQHVITTVDLTGPTAQLKNWITVSNRSTSARTVTLTGTVTNAAGQPLPGVTVPSAQVSVPAGGAAEGLLTVNLPAGSFALWGLDTPNLYTFTTSASVGGAVKHTVADRFGLRTVTVSGTSLLLNGEPVRLNGYNRVGDDRIAGATEPTYLLRRDLDRMKASGANLSRIHHVPQAPELLDYADEKGLLIIEEIPVWGSGANLNPADPVTVGQLTDMIRRDYNHPSVIAWSVANEIQGASAAGRTYVHDVIELARTTLDSSRLYTYVSNSFGSATTGADEALQYTDFACINMYGGFAGGVEHVHGLYPTKPIFVSEYSSDSFTFPITREDVDFTTTSGSAATAFPSRPYVIGSSHWTYNDYRSNYSGTSPNQVRGWGIQNVWGQLKRAYSQLQATNAPVRGLAIVTSAGSGGRLSLLTVTPRGALSTDAPAFTLRGYRLAWQVTSASGQVLDGRLIELPDIAPGAAPITIGVGWTDPGTAVGQRVTLLSPLGYEVAVGVADLRPPAAPTITAVVAADGAARVAFTPVAGALGYTATATAGGTVLTSIDTANPFLDLTGLANGTQYQISVRARNGSGASLPSAPVGVTPAAAALRLPPRWQELAAAPGALVAGFMTVVDATGYQVEVSAGGTVVRDYTTTLKASTRIDGLAAGQPHSVRIRARTAAGVLTAWSEPRTATPLGATAPPALTVHGALRGDDALGVRITADPRAERHEIAVNGGPTVLVEAAALDLLPLTGLLADTDYQLTVRTRSATGWSAPAVVTARTRPAAPTGVPAAPTSVTSSTTGGQTTLSWSAVPAAEGYLITVDQCGTEVRTGTVAGATSLALGAAGAAAGLSYRVRAVSVAGTGAPSAAYLVPGTPGPRQVTLTVAGTGPDCNGVIGYTESGTWLASALTGVDGTPSRYTGTAGSYAVWRPTLAAAATYTVEVWVPANPSSTTAATYAVTHAGGVASVTINQVTQSGGWVALGAWAMAAGTGNVRTTFSGGFLRTNALRFTPAP
jgi:beta-galactosidase